MMKIFIALFFFLFSLVGLSQNLVYRVGGKITNSDSKKNEAGVTVSFIQNGKVLASAVTSTNGKYDISADAPMGGTFIISYTKPGFVTKKISFNGSTMNAEDIPAGAEFPLPTLDMDVFAERSTADFSFLNNEPVASFFWNETKMMLDYDKEASAKVRKKIEELLAKEQKEIAESDTKYQAATNAGQLLYTQKKYDEALVKYTEASKLKPNEQLPITQITALDKLIASQKTEQLAGQKTEQEYKNLIAAADNFKNLKKYDEALLKYKEALTKKDDAYPKGEISRLTTLINDQKAEASKNAEFDKLKTEGMGLATSKKWIEAKSKLTSALAIKQDPTVTAKIKEIEAEIEKEKANKASKDKYDLAVSTGEGFLTSGKYLEAKTKFQEASNLDPSQQLPKQKITQIDGLIADQQKEKELQLKVNGLLTEGNSALVKKDFNTAKIKYEEVLKVDPKNTIAPEKLKIVNSELNALKGDAEKEQLFNQLKKEGFDLATSKKFNEAKLKLEQALGIKNDAIVSQKLADVNKAIDGEAKKSGIDEQYRKIMEEASNFEAAKNYDAALGKYKGALSLKPLEALPKTKITSIEKILKDQQNQNQDEANKAKLYNTHIANGDKNLNLKNYDLAIGEYQKALSIKANDSYALSKISEANQLKDNLAKSKETASNKNTAFDNNMLQADKLFKQKKYLEAKEFYLKALEIVSDDSRAMNQVKECIRLESNKSADQADEGYRKLIAAADKKFNEKDYLKAKEYYERALGIKSNDPYPKSKLDQIEALLNPAPKKTQEPVFIEQEGLKSLGDPYAKSIVEGEEDLKQAEIARKNLQSKKLKNGVNDVNDKYEDFVIQKKSARESATTDVTQTQLSIEAENAEKGKEFQAVIENNKSVRNQQEVYNDQANTYENTDRLYIQEKTDIIKLQNDIESNDKIVQYLEKGTELKSYNTVNSNNSEQAFIDKQGKVINAQVEILEIEKIILNKQDDDRSSKAETEKLIIDQVAKITKKQEDEIAKESLEVKQVKFQINEADKKMSDKALNDANNYTEKGRETINNVIEINKSIEEQGLSNEDNLQNSTEKLRLSNRNLFNNSNDAYNREKEKNIQSKGNIHKKLDKIEETAISSNDKLIESNSLLKSQTKDLIDGNTQQKLDKDQKLLDVQKSINDTQNQTTEKPIIKNSLGEEYPEGVSQESFTQNDENGLMKAIVTRRVVVVEGHGDVYVRTQTSSATTYSKNSTPSSERIWQKETQGPHLVKHY